ncbi:hypothetical protein HD554DRAFT_2042091 [Boletus coccyginus]|nr:hypothetical protein HD554DRAFT_2042091 [Boletus coccyginus]
MCYINYMQHHLQRPGRLMIFKLKSYDPVVTSATLFQSTISSTECHPSLAMSSITVFAETVHSNDRCIIKSIFLNIHFSGIVTLLPSHVPIQVIVKLPEEFAGQLYPVIRGESPFPRDKLQCKYAGLCPPTHWHCLLDKVQCTLLGFAKDIDRNHSDLMQDFFWIVFVVMYPSFPGREWDTWDACINMDSTFITTWLRDPRLQQLRDSQTPDVVSFAYDMLRRWVPLQAKCHIMADWCYE